MADAPSPKFLRRKAARPAEIVRAALAVFSEKGFAAARLDDIAARAGVSKGALYLYFETKDELFRAVITDTVAINLAPVRALIETYPGRFDAFIAQFAKAFAAMASQTPVGPIGKMVVSESRTFPDLARHWHDLVVEPMLGLLSAAVARAQARGEVRAGDSRLFAVQMVSPFLLALLWRETFVPLGAEPFDLDQLAEQHALVLSAGLCLPTGETQ